VRDLATLDLLDQSLAGVPSGSSLMNPRFEVWVPSVRR
jgi:hypothetical protein